MASKSGTPTTTPAATPAATTAPSTAPTAALRKLDLNVPSHWTLPSFYSSASPEETAVALDAAAGLVPWVSKVMRKHQDGQEEARRQGIDETVQSALRCLRTDAMEQVLQEKHASEVANLEIRSQLEEARGQVAELHHSLAAAQQRIVDAEARGRAQCMSESAAHAEAERRRNEVRQTALEEELRRRASEVTAERDALRERCGSLQDAERQLLAENAQLKTPSGRGEAGEADVQRILEHLGYQIVDTSKLKEKDHYGDLLCCIGMEDEPPVATGHTTSMAPAESHPLPGAGATRLAVEVKNRATLRSSEVAAFEAKVRAGVARGLFEGGMLISLRCPIAGMTSCAKQALLEDAEGHPTVPMAYVCAERGSPPRPVLGEHVEIMVQVHMHLIEQIAAVRIALAGSEMDEDETRRVQAHFSGLSTFVTEMFSEFSRHQTVLESARRSLDAMRKTCLVMYRSARRLNAAVPWLQRPMPQLSCEKGVDHAVRLASEGRLQWANVSNREAVFQTLGKDCAQAVVHEELRIVAREASEAEDAAARRSKRSREEEE